MKIIDSFFKFSLWTFLAGVCGATLIFASSILYLSPNLPAVEKLKDIQLQTPLKVYTSDHKLIAEFGEKRRTPLTFDQVPPLFINAILAAEDDRFYQHHGVDITGLIRAAFELVKTGSIRTGGSTITMQVAKNFFLSREKTFIRKFNEILLALQIERELNKNEILSLYVNKNYLGHRSYGIAAAARVYYGQDISELDLAQLAMIAGLPKAPSRYNPITNPSRALVRRNWILRRMRDLGYIDQQSYLEAFQTADIAEYHGLRPEIEASYLAEMVRKEMLNRFGKQAYTAGYNVITTVNSKLQQSANTSVQNGLQSYDLRHGYRGPEAHIEAPNMEEMTADLKTEWHEQIQKTLKGYQVIGPLLPAVVTSVEGENATAIIKRNSAKHYHLNIQTEITLTLESFEWARNYISVNQKGTKPKLASDVLKVGDVIRVKPVLDGLTQKENPATSADIANADSTKVKNSSDIDTENNTENIFWKMGQLPQAQAALVSLSPDNGAIQAIVGGFDFHQSKFNRVIQAGRQAGSNFKPFIYTAALANGFTAASIINDAPVVFNDKSLESTWRPENSSGNFFGPTRLRQALYKSRNLVSIRLLRKMGINNAIDFATQFGFDPDTLPKDLSLALGSAAVTPLEVATGYTAFANGGYKVSSFFIQSINDSENNNLFEATPLFVCHECPVTDTSPGNPTEINETLTMTTAQPSIKTEELTVEQQEEESALMESEDLFLLDSGLLELADEKTMYAERIVEPRIIYIVNSMLRDVIKKGTGRRARKLNRNDIAGKTGTTNDQKDAWFSGFNQDLVTTTWLGFDTPKTLGAREYGGTAALPIWIEFMEQALKGKAENKPKQPEGLVTIKIDPKTGERAKAGQDNAIFEIFREELAPKKLAASNIHTAPTQQEDVSTLEELF